MRKEHSSLPSLSEAKTLARHIRQKYAKAGNAITHSRALELTAQKLGYATWNVASAKLRNNSIFKPHVGDRISGSYLSQAFTGTVIAVKQLEAKDMLRISIEFDEAVDVVSFDTFSNYRNRVTALLNMDGICPLQTSNGEPHLKITSTDSFVI